MHTRLGFLCEIICIALLVNWSNLSLIPQSHLNQMLKSSYNKSLDHWMTSSVVCGKVKFGNCIDLFAFLCFLHYCINVAHHFEK